MNRGCITTGDTKCDFCGRTIQHGERYMCIEEEDNKQRCCIDCCLKDGSATYIKEKSEKILTFFPTKVS